MIKQKMLEKTAMDTGLCCATLFKRAFKTYSFGCLKSCVLHPVPHQRLLVSCLQTKGDVCFNCLFAHSSFLSLLEDKGVRKHQFGF